MLSATPSQPARDVERLWTLEAIGIADAKDDRYSAAELEALKQFQESVSYDGKQYAVGMPKLNSIVNLANNLDVARKRLVAKRRGLIRDPAAFRRYDQ